jgi:hypothetical protein
VWVSSSPLRPPASSSRPSSWCNDKAGKHSESVSKKQKVNLPSVWATAGWVLRIKICSASTAGVSGSAGAANMIISSSRTRQAMLWRQSMSASLHCEVNRQVKNRGSHCKRRGFSSAGAFYRLLESGKGMMQWVVRRQSRRHIFPYVRHKRVWIRFRFAEPEFSFLPDLHINLCDQRALLRNQSRFFV